MEGSAIDGVAGGGAALAIVADVWFDTRCPWCFIGKRRFERAIEVFAAAHPAVPVSVRHRSFELAPDIPERFDGTEVEYMHRYEGVPLERGALMLPEIERIAADEGVPIRFDGLPLVNTRRAHRVFQYGAEQGAGEEVLERLFVGYFGEHRDLADPAVLGALAAEAGLDAAGAAAAAADEKRDRTIKNEWRRAQMLGMAGVPFFLLNSRYSIRGAVSAEQFAPVLEAVLARDFTESA